MDALIHVGEAVYLIRFSDSEVAAEKYLINRKIINYVGQASQNAYLPQSCHKVFTCTSYDSAL